jgi:peptidoglycan/LPS O-acetylase OafA/YrhL
VRLKTSEKIHTPFSLNRIDIVEGYIGLSGVRSSGKISLSFHSNLASQGRAEDGWVPRKGIMGQKGHFAGLDGLRGIAALAVVGLHGNQFIKFTAFHPSTYLAVDFFFILSGFVIAYAYDERIKAGLRLGSFLRIRLIRLYPMLFFGALLGGVSMVSHHLLSDTDNLDRAVTLALAGLLLLPAGLAFGFEAYPVNNPIWSLFFEIVANVLYPCLLRLAKITWAILIFCALALTFLTWSYQSVEFMGFDDGSLFLAGFARVIVPFLCGALIFHSRLFERFPAIPFIAVAGALLAVLLTWTPLPWLFDLAAIFLLLPALVCLGARAPMTSPGLWKFCEISGKISYPLYLVHQPVMRAVAAVAQMPRFHLSPALSLAVGVGISIGLAWFALKFYDEPVRYFLSHRPAAKPREHVAGFPVASGAR